MKLKTLALSLAVAGATSVAMIPAAAQAGVSANAGVFTDYIWRGADQTTNNTVALQGGVDYEADNGIYAGVWASTLDTGYEYDLYVGYGGTFNGVDLGAAYTAYRGTDEDTFGTGVNEVNLSAGYGMISVGYDIDVTNSDSSAKHYSISADLGDYADGVAVTYGATDVAGNDYFDFSYGTEVEGVDFGFDFIHSTANGNFVTVGLTKSFDLM